MAELNVTLQELRGTYKEFTAKNPILMDGQLAVVTIETGDSVGGFIAPSTGLKCGDGKTAFNNLTWLAGREQLINTGSTASNAILHKQNQELYMTRSEFDKLDKTTLPVGTEINIVDQIQKQDLATDIQKSLTNADTALTNANTALSTANNALPKSGGTITGNLVVSGNETLNGALTVSGTTTLSNTNFTAGSIVKRVDADGDEIGVVQFRHIEEAAVPFGTFETGYDYRIGDADAVEWYFPETNIPSDLYAIMHFNSGATATTIMIDEDCVLTGDDCKGGVFTPVANKKYSVFVWYDGTKQGVVRGVPTDGKWEDGAITIGSSTATSPAELKKVVYCPSASVPTTPEAGVEYALTDLIGEEDLNSSLQTKINSFATKAEVNAVSTVANNALSKEDGGVISGNLTVDGTLMNGNQKVATESYVNQAISKYDLTFSDLSILQSYLSNVSETAAGNTSYLAGKHILFTGEFAEWGEAIDFYGADLTVEHEYNYVGYCGNPYYQTLTNIGTLHGEKWTTKQDDGWRCYATISASVVDGLGLGIYATITADVIRNACIKSATSKSGTQYVKYGTISNCAFVDYASVKNYDAVINCVTPPNDQNVTFTNCTVYTGLRQAQPTTSSSGDGSGSGAGASAKWRASASDATTQNPVKFVRFDTSMENATYCGDPPATSEITVGVSQLDENGRASQMVINEYEPQYGGGTNTQIYHIVITYKTDSVGAISQCVVKYYNMKNNTVTGKSSYSNGSWTTSYPYISTSFKYYY